ncbi:DUF4326 domain-containing protein [Lysobacter sp. A6]|uniref:DUF4326 domain-containing protein n=1 Tax=Noviluteimonas lactosilytica TaxID=2888523 RepID=A0ABS8JKY4_9GAMM|nr:DUF4326 domain-containing protein [Lysobacter lactosilyticus]MCC8364271.1 DUF4326 domain-containing protein [Lysobacter lactosilyticus]
MPVSPKRIQLSRRKGWRAQFSREHVRSQLAGLDLACWCPLDGPCHADVLIDIANARDPRDERKD